MNTASRRGLVMAAVVVALTGIWLLRADHPSYEATARFVVGPLAGDDDTVRAAGALSRTYAQTAESEPLLDEAAEALGLAPNELSAEVDATGEEVTRLVVISVRDDDAAVAAGLANALVGALERRTAGDSVRPEAKIAVLDPASVPTKPVGQGTLRTILPALLIAGSIAAGLVLLINGTSGAGRASSS